MPQQSQQGPDPNDRFVGDILVGVFRSVALTVEVFLHWGFGTAYVGCGPAGVFSIWLFSLLFDPRDVSPLLRFSAVYAAVWVAAAACAVERSWRRGGRPRLHSDYGGRPHLHRLVPGWDEAWVKHLEGPAVALLGYGVGHANVPLGDYLMVAGSVAFARAYLLAASIRRVATDLSDRAIEQGEVAERFRDVHGP